MLNLDTHIFVYALIGQLKPKENRLLEGARWGVSAIVLWELAKLVQLQRVRLDFSTAAYRRALREVTVWPITWDIAHKSTQLDVDSDLADEIIAATSVVHRVPLLTRDKRLLKSKAIPLAG